MASSLSARDLDSGYYTPEAAKDAELQVGWLVRKQDKQRAPSSEGALDKPCRMVGRVLEAEEAGEEALLFLGLFFLLGKSIFCLFALCFKVGC